MKRPVRTQSFASADSSAAEQAEGELLEEELLEATPLPELYGEVTLPGGSDQHFQWQLVRLPTVWLMGYEISTPDEPLALETQLQSALREFVSKQLLRRIPGQQTDRVICLAWTARVGESEAVPDQKILIGAEVDAETPIPQGMAKWAFSTGTSIVMSQQAGAEPVEPAVSSSAIEVKPVCLQHVGTFQQWLAQQGSLTWREGPLFERHDLNSPGEAKIFLPARLKN